MTGTDDTAGNNFMAEARSNLRSSAQLNTIASAKTAGASQPHSASQPNAVPKSVGRFLVRFAKGSAFLALILFFSIGLTLLNGWLAVGLVVVAAAVCFSRRLKSHGLSIPVGVLLLLIGFPMTIMSWSMEEKKVALAPLRQSDPAAYLEKSREILTRKEWLAEAELLAPNLYHAELAKDEAAKSDEQKAAERQLAAERAAERERLFAEMKANSEKKAEARRYAEHCRSVWDGSVETLTKALTKSLREPDSFEHITTLISPIDGDGFNRVEMEYRARNGFGGMSIERIVVKMRNADCAITEQVM